MAGYGFLLDSSRELIEARDRPAVLAIACAAARRLTGADESAGHAHDAGATVEGCIAHWADAAGPDGSSRSHGLDAGEVKPLLAGLAANASAALANVESHSALRLEAQERTAELDGFTYAISHDLRAPIRHLDGFAGILMLDLLDHEGLDPKLRHSAERIQDAAGQLREMVNGLLAFSRTSRTSLKRQPVDLAGLARDVTLRLAHEASPDRAGVVEFMAPEQLPVFGDPKLLHAALQELLANAWKFTAGVARPVVELGVATGWPDELAGPTDTGAELVYFVRDNGAGFDTASTGRLFGAFQRLHRHEDFPGLGLGLVTAARIIAKHGGVLRGRGVVDQGATFFFTLPG